MIKRKDEYDLEINTSDTSCGNYIFHHIVNKNDRPSNLEYMGIMEIEPGEECGMHHHADVADVYYIIQGTAEYIDNKGKKTVLNAGDTSCCYAGESHAISNIGSIKLIVMAVLPKA